MQFILPAVFFAEAKPLWAPFSLKSFGDWTKFVATVRESLYTVEYWTTIGKRIK